MSMIVVAVPVPVTNLIPTKVLIAVMRGVFAAMRIRALVSMMRVIAVIDMSAKVACAMKPWAGAHEDPAAKPLRSIVAIGSASVRCVVIIAVGASRSRSYLYGNLSRLR